MGLFLAGLALAIAGVLLAMSPGGATLVAGIVAIIGGGVFMLRSGADPYSTGVLLAIVAGFGYFLRTRNVVDVEDGESPDTDENELADDEA